MNSHDRRTVERMIKLAVADAIGPRQPPPPAPAKPPATQPKPPRQRSVWRRVTLGWAALTLAGSIAGAFLTAYVALPSWSLALPSASYRPRNPFTAVFTVTNSGYFPGKDVHVLCIQNMIRYTNLGIFQNPYSAGLIGGPTDLGSIYKNESRTFSCPQVLRGLKVRQGVMTPAQAAEDYQESLRATKESQEDMPFDWADFEFQVSYSLAFLHFTDKFRVVGRPAIDGSFVWEQVPLDKVF